MEKIIEALMDLNVCMLREGFSGKFEIELMEPEFERLAMHMIAKHQVVIGESVKDFKEITWLHLIGPRNHMTIRKALPKATEVLNSKTKTSQEPS